MKVKTIKWSMVITKWMVKVSGSARKNSAQAIISLISAKIMELALPMMNRLIRDQSVFARYALNYEHLLDDSYLTLKSLDWMGRSFMWKENRALTKFICTSSDFKFLNFLFNWFFHLKRQFIFSPNTVQDDCLIIKYHSANIVLQVHFGYELCAEL